MGHFGVIESFSIKQNCDFQGMALLEVMRGCFLQFRTIKVIFGEKNGERGTNKKGFLCKKLRFICQIGDFSSGGTRMQTTRRGVLSKKLEIGGLKCNCYKWEH